MTSTAGSGTFAPAAGGQSRASMLSVGVTFAVLALLAVSVVIVPGASYVALSAAILAALFVYLRSRRRAGRQDLFEVVVPFTILYFLYFGLGAIYLGYRPEDLPDPVLREFVGPALALAVAAYVSFLAGYGTLLQRTAPSTLTRLVPVHPMAYIIPAVLGAAGQAVHEVQVLRLNLGLQANPLLSALQQFSPMFFMSWFLGWYAWLGGAMRRSHALIVFPVLLAGTCVITFYTFGAKLVAIVILGMPVMAFYYVRRHLPKKALIASTLLVVFVVVPIYNTFRQQGRELGTVRRLDRTVQQATKWDSDLYLDNSVFAFMKRLTIVSSVAAILCDTGRRVDYRYGDTLILAPIGLLIPRFIWPDKPSISIGREFGDVFRLKNSLDVETEISPSIVGDFYWNFGVPGVVVGMFLFGAGFQWYYRRYGEGVAFDPIRKSIYVGVLPTILLIEGNVAFLAAGVVKSLILISAYWIVCRRLGWVQPLAALPATPPEDTLGAETRRI